MIHKIVLFVEALKDEVGVHNELVRDWNTSAIVGYIRLTSSLRPRHAWRQYLSTTNGFCEGTVYV